MHNTATPTGRHVIPFAKLQIGTFVGVPDGKVTREKELASFVDLSRLIEGTNDGWDPVLGKEDRVDGNKAPVFESDRRLPAASR